MHAPQKISSYHHDVASTANTVDSSNNNDSSKAVFVRLTAVAMAFV